MRGCACVCDCLTMCVYTSIITRKERERENGQNTSDFLDSFFIIMSLALLPDMETFSSCCSELTSIVTDFPSLAC